ncbi:hypothetical protein BDD12DRAFT_875462 [Trichophaea hybrida]|nr:hypothetical protein BDD12DRAFT_875462 [Trichophaea hybrida]
MTSNESSTSSLRRKCKWLRLTTIANRTTKNPELAKKCLNYAYVSRIVKLGRKSIVKWYTSAGFKEAKKLVEKGCPSLDEGINLGEMALKQYRGLIMPVGLYPFKEDHARIRTLSPSVSFHTSSLSRPGSAAGITTSLSPVEMFCTGNHYFSTTDREILQRESLLLYCR